MGKVTNIEVEGRKGTNVLTARIKKKGQEKFSKSIILKGGENNERQKTST